MTGILSILAGASSGFRFLADYLVVGGGGGGGTVGGGGAGGYLSLTNQTLVTNKSYTVKIGRAHV